MGRDSALLRVVHQRPGISRVEAATLLGLGTGAAAELVARLVGARLLSERPQRPTGNRGRPSSQLVAHPLGPLVLAAAITQAAWQIDVIELGGERLASRQGPRADDPADVLNVMAAAAAGLRRRFPGRVHGLGISAPGTVRDGRTLDAVGLGWREIDLGMIWPRGALVRADNDATLAALAEARRGHAVDAELALYLRIEVGLGGALVERDRIVRGARGLAGEFGHMPFGDAEVVCGCGATGCWGTTVDGAALARLLEEPEPTEPIGYAREVIAGSRSGGVRERRAVGDIATALGRGTAGLVNGLDPDVVVLGGLAQLVAETQPAPLEKAYRSGLMDFRRAQVPPLLTSALGDPGLLTGAAEQVWDELWPHLRS